MVMQLLQSRGEMKWLHNPCCLGVKVKVAVGPLPSQEEIKFAALPLPYWGKVKQLCHPCRLGERSRWPHNPCRRVLGVGRKQNDHTNHAFSGSLM